MERSKDIKIAEWQEEARNKRVTKRPERFRADYDPNPVSGLFFNAPIQNE